MKGCCEGGTRMSDGRGGKFGNASGREGGEFLRRALVAAAACALALVRAGGREAGMTSTSISSSPESSSSSLLFLPLPLVLPLAPTLDFGFGFTLAPDLLPFVLDATGRFGTGACLGARGTSSSSSSSSTSSLCTGDSI